MRQALNITSLYPDRLKAIVIIELIQLANATYTLQVLSALFSHFMKQLKPKKPILLLAWLTLSPLVVADSASDRTLSHNLGLRLGAPSTHQNVSIETRDFYLRYSFETLNIGLLIPGIEAGITQLEVADEKAYSYSMGPIFTIPIMGTNNIFSLTGHGKIHWLTQYDFGRKHYGGPIQASYGVGIKGQLTPNLYIDYIWQHISNGDRYSHNPSLETHNLGFGVGF